jgi:hypothetical protein
MPLPGVSKVPSFDGEASELTEFLMLFEDLVKSHGLPGDERCKYLVHYVDSQTKRFWVMLPGFATGDYDRLKKNIIAEYPGVGKGISIPSLISNVSHAATGTLKSPQR